MEGLEVITTCSEKNFDLARTLGANHVFDYRDPEIERKVAGVAPDLQYAFDTIGSSTSSATAASAMSGKGKLCTVRPGKANTEDVPKSVEVTDVLVWRAFLADHRYGDFFWPVGRMQDPQANTE